MATKRKAYTVTTKLQAVEVAEKTSKETAARQFSVDPRRIREWCAQKDALEKKLRSREVPSEDDWTEDLRKNHERREIAQGK